LETSENPGVDFVVDFVAVDLDDVLLEAVLLDEVLFEALLVDFDEEAAAALVVAGFDGNVGPTASTVVTPIPTKDRVVNAAIAAPTRVNGIRD
jgi:hypothetical protein